MNRIRTSLTHPLRIDAVSPRGVAGSIGMTLCPGKIQRNAVTGEWRRDLREDLAVIKAWGATAVLNLLTDTEMRELGVPQLEDPVTQRGMDYFHLPIEDGGVPDGEAENRWSEIGACLRDYLKQGHNVLIHCKGGLGRTGTMAARLLVELGSSSKEAVKEVRNARPGAIENSLQEQYIHRQLPVIEDAQLPEISRWHSRSQEREGVRERFLGCLLGGAVGDAMGAPVEFMRLSEIQDRFGPGGVKGFEPAYGRRGAVTDDTQMTLFTAEGLIRGYVRWCWRGITTYPGVTAHAYQRWLRTQGVMPDCSGFSIDDNQGWLFQQDDLHHRRAPGNTCISALKKMRHFGDPSKNDSKGCGGVMRIAPVGLFGWHSRDSESVISVFDLGREIAALTHGHPTGSLTAGVLAITIMGLTDGASLEEALKAATDCLTCYSGHGETRNALIMAMDLAKTSVSPREAINQLGQGWVAEEALAIGVYCALKAQDFRKGILMAVNHDGDSDSTGSITGNLLGTMLGLNAIPQEWLNGLELREVIEELANDLFEMYTWDIGEDDDPELSTAIGRKYPGW
jgi:ADP-ribosylglycohydrolase/protein-tyrosine phosphatase